MRRSCRLRPVAVSFGIREQVERWTHRTTFVRGLRCVVAYRVGRILPRETVSVHGGGPSGVRRLWGSGVCGDDRGVWQQHHSRAGGGWGVAVGLRRRWGSSWPVGPGVPGPVDTLDGQVVRGGHPVRLRPERFCGEQTNSAVPTTSRRTLGANVVTSGALLCDGRCLSAPVAPHLRCPVPSRSTPTQQPTKGRGCAIPNKYLCSPRLVELRRRTRLRDLAPRCHQLKGRVRR
jgi:hypothetical protein